MTGRGSSVLGIIDSSIPYVQYSITRINVIPALQTNIYFYQLHRCREQGDNAIGSVRLSFCPLVSTLLAEPSSVWQNMTITSSGCLSLYL